MRLLKRKDTAGMNEMYEAEKKLNKEQYQKAMASNLKMLRAKCSMTQEELSCLIGVSRQTIVHAENYGKLSWTAYLALVQLFSRNSEALRIMQMMNVLPECFSADR